MARNGKIILAKNIKLDKEYQNVLTYSENDMLTLVTTNQVAYAEDYSFIRETGRIRVGFPYSVCLSANYMAFQNPDYSGKWFFAFIDKVNYISNATTEIEYTVDIFSTWWSYWDSKPCFVVREHVNDDTVGANTIPEGLETGEYISCKLQPTLTGSYETCFCVASTEKLFQGYTTFNESVPTGLYYTGLTTLQGVEDLISRFDAGGQNGIIQSVFVIPKVFFTNWGSVAGINGEVATGVGFYTNNTEISVTRVNYLANDYIPVNKKLLCFPYSFLQVSNHNGQIVNYYWEDFNLLPLENATDNITFYLRGTLTPGGSFACYPINYKNILNNFDESISLGKFPLGGWNTDPYTNWLTQQGLNIPGVGNVDAVTKNTIGSALSMVVGGALIATGAGSVAGAGLLAGGAMGIFNTMQSAYQHDLQPKQAHGNTNTGDYSYSFNLTNLEFKRISIKEEYARSIDEYFTRLGYKVNRLKLPNQTGRQNWNFVQIATGESLAYQKANVTGIPSDDLATINKLYQRGITLWHSHDNIGNYNLTNSIITP